jgi:isopentenyl-diphosphate delta-isomerase type 1
VQEEIFDVVNDRDEIIDQLPRSEVHRLGLKHRAVHVLIFNAKGELFLQKRSMNKDTFPGCWDSSAAGHLNPGEAYDDCAIREVREELGYEMLGVPKRILRIEACEETGQEFVWVYRCEAEGPFRLDPIEVETGGWFSRAEIQRWLAEKPEEFAPSFPCLWRQLEA